MTVPTLKAVDVITTGDNVIVLNDDVVGAPSEDAGIEVERGTSLNAQLLFNESSDFWEAGISGTMSRLVRYLELSATSGTSGASLVGFDDAVAALGASNAQDAIVALDSALDSHAADSSIHFAVGSIDHTALLNVGINSHAAIDSALTDAANHRADSTIHFTQSAIDHTTILNVGVNSHAAIDSHITAGNTHFADLAIHFTESSIDHTSILNVGVNNHAAIDLALTDASNHRADGTIHFTEASIDHTAITNIGTNSHAAIDSALLAAANHILDSTIHFTEASIDHTAISNIGVNSHAQIDAHIAAAASLRAVYMFLVADLNINGTSPLATGAIPWNQSRNSGYAAGSAVVAVTASTNRDLTLEVFDIQTATVIGTVDVLSGAGFVVVEFAITNPTADTVLELRAFKSSAGGDNPTLHTASMEYGV